MRIDAHLSLWQDAPPEVQAHPRFPGADRSFVPAHIEPILARNRFDGAVVFTAGGSAREAETVAGWCTAVPCLLGFSARWPEDHPSPEPPAHLRALRSAGTLCGIWLPAQSAHLPDAARFCHNHGLALDVLPTGDPFPSEALLSIADAYPTLPIVLAHSAGPPLANEALKMWMTEIVRLAERPNLCLKLSAMWSSGLDGWNIATLQSLVAFVLETFGERRVLFGSDWPYSLPAHSWKECLARFTQALGPRTMDLREEVLGNTAARVYGILSMEASNR